MSKDQRQYGQQRPEKKSFGHSPWLYGTHAVWAAYLNPERNIRRLLLTEVHREEHLQYAAQAETADLKRPAPEFVEKYSLDKLAGGEGVHQGIACEAAALPYVDMADLKRSLAVRERAVLLMLDQVTDPHNIGAIMRSAAAFGALAVIVQDRHTPPITGTIAKIASGGIEHVPLVYVTNLSDTLNQLHEAGCQSIALDERGEQTLDVLLTAANPPLAGGSKSPGDFGVGANPTATSPHPEALTALRPSHEGRVSGTSKTILVLGAEGAGLRPKVRETCTYLARLPTNPNFSALNVSNAAAVGLFALAKGAK